MPGKIIKKILCILILTVGIAVFVYPEAAARRFDRETETAVTAFETAAEEEAKDAARAEAEAGSAAEDGEERAAESGGEDSGGADILISSESLRESVQAYNAGLWETRQADYSDAWAVAQAPSIEGLDDAMFGYIEIPAMDTELPLYIGASAANLARGAAVLGATSLPVGGENTNCIIAAHRGYRGIPFFRDIEKLSVGDSVYITNPWGTLGYRVESVDIIDPTDSDKVKIREGRDMVTLMTCHPYRSNGRYRYVVYCIRDDSVLSGDARQGGAEAAYIMASDGTVYEASQPDIEKETLFRRVCAAALILFFLICLLTGRRRHGNLH
ncbi:MAG: class C sortase [Lachnospiraceae bacterium]|nr:class C sortase [Lachnospiraceae bacterium]